MMKRIPVLVLCLLVSGSAAFGLDKAVGGGILGGFASTSGTIDMGQSADWTMNRGYFGAFGFFGISQYMELNLGFLFKSIDDIKVTAGGYSQTVSGSQAGIGDTQALQLGVYGKYPIPISDALVFFPTGGLDVEITLSDDEGWWSDVWIRGGVGVDFFFSEKLFLRGHLIYGAAIPVGGDRSSIEPKFGHGALVKVGLGWMLSCDFWAVLPPRQPRAVLRFVQNCTFHGFFPLGRT